MSSARTAAASSRNSVVACFGSPCRGRGSRMCHGLPSSVAVVERRSCERGQPAPSRRGGQLRRRLRPSTGTGRAEADARPARDRGAGPASPRGRTLDMPDLARSRASERPRSDCALPEQSPRACRPRAQDAERQLQHGRAHLGAEPCALPGAAEPRAGADRQRLPEPFGLSACEPTGWPSTNATRLSAQRSRLQPSSAARWKRDECFLEPRLGRAIRPRRPRTASPRARGCPRARRRPARAARRRSRAAARAAVCGGADGSARCGGRRRRCRSPTTSNPSFVVQQPRPVVGQRLEEDDVVALDRASSATACTSARPRPRPRSRQRVDVLDLGHTAGFAQLAVARDPVAVERRRSSAAGPPARSRFRPSLRLAAMCAEPQGSERSAPSRSGSISANATSRTAPCRAVGGPAPAGAPSPDASRAPTPRQRALRPSRRSPSRASPCRWKNASIAASAGRGDLAGLGDRLGAHVVEVVDVGQRVAEQARAERSGTRRSAAPS